MTTLTYDYGDQMAAVGPLGASGDPHAHDLCAIHTDRLSVPKGWLVVRHETLRAQPDDAPRLVTSPFLN